MLLSTLIFRSSDNNVFKKKHIVFFKLNFSVLYGKLIILWPVGHWANLSKNMKNLHNFFLTTANNTSAADLRASTLWTLSYYMSSLKDNYHHLQSLHYITGIHNKTNALDSMKEFNPRHWWRYSAEMDLYLLIHSRTLCVDPLCVTKKFNSSLWG